MADSNIEWTDKVWNPVVGCDKVSAGCQACYAIRTAYRLEHGFKQPEYQGTTRKLPNGSVNWTGKVVCLPERLSIPLRWKKPARIFVNSMSDLFHEDVPDEFIAYVFGVMALAQQHTFQVLTKRPQRMLQWFTADRILETTADYAAWAAEHIPGNGQIIWDARGSDPDNYIGALPMRFATPEERAAHHAKRRRWPGWPLPNVWLGVSVEDQHAADERIPLLLQTPAAVRWLSCEPLLGPIDLREWLPYYTACGASRDAETQAALDDVFRAAVRHMGGPSLHWCIAGGESGPNYRPMDLDWARSLRDQCQASVVPFHFKQIGGFTHAAGGRLLDGRTWDEYPAPRRELAHA